MDMKSLAEMLAADMDPQALDRILKLQSMPQRTQLVQQQLDSAQRLRAPTPQRKGVFGTALSGIGNAIGQGLGAARESEALRQMKGLADEQAAALQGLGPAYQQHATRLRTREESEATRAAESHALQQQTGKLKLGAQQAEFDDANAPASQGMHELAKRFKTALPPGATNRQAMQHLGLAKEAYEAEQRAVELNLNRRIAADQRAQAQGFQQQKELDGQIETLSKRLEGAPAIKNNLMTLLNFANSGGDVPGVGQTGMAPDALLTSEGTQVRQAARGLVGQVIHARSGTAASKEEVNRILKEFGLHETSTDDQFRLGLQRYLPEVIGTLQAKEAGARPEAVQEARRRGLTTSKDIEDAAGGTVVEERALPDGRVIQLLSNGQKRLKP